MSPEEQAILTVWGSRHFTTEEQQRVSQIALREALALIKEADLLPELQVRFKRVFESGELSEESLSHASFPHHRRD